MSYLKVILSVDAFWKCFYLSPVKTPFSSLQYPFICSAFNAKGKAIPLLVWKGL